jgi:hypothetical protein
MTAGLDHRVQRDEPEPEPDHLSEAWRLLVAAILNALDEIERAMRVAGAPSKLERST